MILLGITAPLFAAEVTAGIEVQHDSIRYHFDNDSSWDTSFLVPHFFEQRYSGSKQMLVVRVRSAAWDMEVAATPVLTLRGSDYDTFFQTTGDVVVHGTTTDVSARSWRIAQHFDMRGPWRLRLAYARDQMKFPASISTTTHTMPPSSTSSLSTTRESTTSDVVDLGVRYERTRMSGVWEWSGAIDLMPVTSARLTTYLPDKYDHPVRFNALGFSGAGRAAITRHAGRARIALHAGVGAGREYRKTSAFRREFASAGIAFGWGSR